MMMLFGLWAGNRKLLFTILWSKSEGLALHGGMDGGGGGGGGGVMKGQAQIGENCVRSYPKKDLWMIVAC